eukprot:gnl/MRDRNA2_/MRDRNA2_64196_c0_seq1.p1 gnl/MRDRNA2_/MRDRNA2_64196_c0~~gnl/MRDRNA2_/MRDRNA2_64196_c0_seq1.p1  ORF type:complete len:298 (+),score=24.35 gnl/MRDRNA2_/MRDRNA2_64196_c0_seq1:93-896(+)
MLYARALYLDATAVQSRPERGTCWRWGKLWWLVVTEGFLFVYVLLFLGLADHGTPKPFSNIRMHGGSNHYFLPTGLIQRFVGESPYFAGSPFSSEVIRVESTSSSYINGVYPSEMTTHLTPRTRELLKIVGHSGRVFCPAAGRIVMQGKVPRNQPGPDFIPYTLPVFELRRLLDEVRQQSESFTLEYTRLPSYDASQPKATGIRVRLSEDGSGGRNCTLVDKNSPCGPEEVVYSPPLGYWVAKHMAFWPHAIIPGQPEPHSGYCFAE